MFQRRRRGGFTLIEVLTVIAVVGLLIAILVPSLSRAREQARTVVCSSRLSQLGRGLTIYANEYDDELPPGRMPKGNGMGWTIPVEGGLKYRPTFLAVMATQVGLQPFADPQIDPDEIDQEGEQGDRQNYASELFHCTETPDWTDERNGSFGYNYQFLGNARITNPSNLSSFKNWPVKMSRFKSGSGTVAVGDSIGTAASFDLRKPYSNNSTDVDRKGNEGFNLDPPAVDSGNGEMAEFDNSPQARTALDERHRGQGNVLRLDGHVSGETLKTLGYTVDESTGVVLFEGSNRQWTPFRTEGPWLQSGSAPP